jgi:hypothetical protein
LARDVSIFNSKSAKIELQYSLESLRNWADG